MEEQGVYLRRNFFWMTPVNFFSVRVYQDLARVNKVHISTPENYLLAAFVATSRCSGDMSKISSALSFVPASSTVGEIDCRLARKKMMAAILAP